MTVRTRARLLARLSNARHGNEAADLRDSIQSVYPLYQDYSPTWTNFALVNGTDDSRYAQLGTGPGSLVLVQINVELGSSSAVSGAIIGSLPVTSRAYPMGAAETILGPALFTDPGAQFYMGYAHWQTTTTFQLRYGNADDAIADRVVLGATSSTIPFTFGTGDSFSASFFYEAG